MKRILAVRTGVTLLIVRSVSGLLLLLPVLGVTAAWATIDRGLFLEVTVKDEKGAPISGAEIVAEGLSPGEGRPVYTQAEGWAVLTGLDKGDYRIKVSAAHYTSVVYQDHLTGSDHVSITLRRVSKTGQPPVTSTVGLADLAAPRKAQVKYREGLTYLQKGKYEKGRQAFEAAIAVYPSYSAAHAGLGTSLLHLGKREDALRAFLRALELDDRSYDAHLSIGLILNDQKRYGEAYRYLSVAAGLRSNHAWPLYYELGRAYYGMDRLSEAENTLSLARQARPRYGNLYLLLANTLALQQKYEQAIAEFEEYLEIAPQSPAAGEVRYKLGLLRAEVEKQEK